MIVVMQDKSSDIDFVIPWVDGDDPEWQRCRNKYVSGVTEGNDVFRFRDWGLLRYWFRGVEKYAPWVRRIHFITWGHVPDWLNVEHPKLNIVRHDDFIPAEWLPTFSANPIELNVHRIKGLAEQFVYFNDDTFIIDAVSPKDFFNGGGLPCGSAILMPARIIKGDWFVPMLNNIAIINEHFSPRKSVMHNLKKWITPKNGRLLISTLLMLSYPFFYGFKEWHIPNSFLKNTFEIVWNEEPEILQETSSHKFRHHTDVTQWLMENWQFASGSFYPRSAKFGKSFFLMDDTVCSTQILCDYIISQKAHIVCVNDGPIDEDLFEDIKSRIRLSFQSLLPDLSMFEK